LNYTISYVDGVLTVTTRPDQPDPTLGLRFDPQAVAAGYSDLTSPLLQIPGLQYVTDEEAASADGQVSTVRIDSGGLNVQR
jgi:hypothetical protein